MTGPPPQYGLPPPKDGEWGQPIRLNTIDGRGAVLRPGDKDYELYAGPKPEGWSDPGGQSTGQGGGVSV